MRVPPLVQVAAAALPLLGQPLQAQAQAPSQQGGTVRVGTLRCDVAGGTSFIFGSTRAIACDFVNVNGKRERYTGEISRYGVDLGFTQAAVMLWAVLAPTTDLQPGVLAGTFVGVVRRRHGRHRRRRQRTGRRQRPLDRAAAAQHRGQHGPEHRARRRRTPAPGGAVVPGRIVTLTLNPSVDVACEAEAVRPVRKTRTFIKALDPGGGGVNVSRVVRELGGDTLAVVTVGSGAAGSFLVELLAAAGVPHRAVPVRGRTRITQVVQDLSSGLEYRFVPEGPALEEAEWRGALAALAEEPGGWVVLSGSLPRGVPDDTWARAIQEARASGRKVVLDSSGPALRAALDAGGGVELVKPSQGEFEALLGRELREADAIAAAAAALARSGAARLVAVTLGHRGAVLASAERSWRLPAPDVPVRGASGAGDSFIAAMTLALARGDSPEDAFAWGSAAGGATVAASGTAHARRAEVEALYAEMRRHLA